MNSLYLFSVMLSSLILAVSCNDDNLIKNDWEVYKKLNIQKLENPLEEAKKFENYKQNYLKVIEHNREYDQNKHTYRVSLNALSHLSPEEAKTTKFGLKSIRIMNSSDTFVHETNPRFIIPDKVDWRPYSAAIKDQLSCGSCWAFASIGVVESLYAIKNKYFKRLSEQQLIDCTLNNNKYLSYGCDGGWPENGFEYIKQMGVVEESVYPYKHGEFACNQRNDTLKVKISKYFNLPYGDENELKKTVAMYGPVAIGIDASLWGFEHYSTGIYSDPKCDSVSVNHAVIIMGYGTEAGRDFWLIKNSWGTKWGYSGYMKLARNKKNMCGVASMATFAYM